MRVNLKIEHLLFFFSVFCFISTVVLHLLEIRNFKSALICIEENQSDSEIFPGNEYDCGNLKAALKPFLISPSDFPKNQEALKIALYENHMYLLQVHNYFYLVSFFLVTLSVFITIHKLLVKKNKFAVQNAQNEMRLAFSREVHDGLAQNLAALKISIQKKDEKNTEYFVDLALKESRFLIEEMHTEFFQDFIQDAKEILSAFENSFSVQTDFLCASQKIKNIPKKDEHSLLRILNESLSNIARHSKATLVKVKVIDVIGGFRLIVSDNGGGLKAADENLTVRSKKHFGIENIKERARQMNGTVDINFTNENGGTTIAVTIKDSLS